MDLNRKISDMTLGELLEVLAPVLQSPMTVHGISGLAQLFGVSESTAKRIKASGVIDDAVSQSGRTIVTDSAKALELYARATHGRRNTTKHS